MITVIINKKTHNLKTIKEPSGFFVRVLYFIIYTFMDRHPITQEEDPQFIYEDDLFYKTKCKSTNK